MTAIEALILAIATGLSTTTQHFRNSVIVLGAVKIRPMFLKMFPMLLKDLLKHILISLL